MFKENIVLTGVPRSGTTLTCYLLNKLPTCVALHEPLSPLELVGQDRPALVEATKNFFYEQRQQILDTGQALSKSVAGEVPDNSMAGFDSATGKRVRVLDGKHIAIKKKLNENFCLIIKQPAFFTAILPDLVNSNYFNCFAVIRNPLSVLLSWNSVDMPVSKGRSPGAEGFSKDLKNQLDSIDDLYEKQIYLLDWFYQQYSKYLPNAHIIYYENTIQSSGRSLSMIHHDAIHLAENLSSKNNNSLYNSALKEKLFKKILEKPDAAFWRFYSKKDISEEMYS